MIKNKRLKPEVEKSELELFRKGQFVIEDEEKEDATAVTANPPEEKKVCNRILLFIRDDNMFLIISFEISSQKHQMQVLVQKALKLRRQYNILGQLQMYIRGYLRW